MNIQFNNLNTMMQKQHLTWNLLMNFIDKLETYDEDKIKKYSEKLNSIHVIDNPYNGKITIKSKTLALLNLSKKEIKEMINQDSMFFFLYNKDFKTIYNKIIKINPVDNPEIEDLELFFRLAINSNIDHIEIHKEKDLLRL